MRKLILFFCYIIIFTGCSSKVYNEYIENGDIKLEEQNYGEALEYFKMALEEKPNDEIAINKITELKNKYENDLRNVVDLMLTQSTKAEKMINTYSKVWNTSIKMTISDERMANILNIDTDEVRKYFKSDNHGYIAFKGNFQIALNKTYNYFEETGKNGELNSKRDEITHLIRKLNNPPQEYKDAYNVAFEMYSEYENFISLALSPSGSLVTYNQKANELSSKIVTKLKEFEVKLPIK